MPSSYEVRDALEKRDEQPLLPRLLRLAIFIAFLYCVYVAHKDNSAPAVLWACLSWSLLKGK